MKCTMQHLLWISFLVFSSSILLANSVNTDCDIMILLDSSQSITMGWFIKEIEFAKTMVNSTTSSLPETANIGAINYSGCPSGTFEECISMGRLLTLWGLQTYADDLPSVYNSFAELDNNDFTKGKSWTDDALRLALLQFQNYSSNPSEKNIVLLTDRQPTVGHEPCKTSTNYTSTTLQQLNEMNVTIYLVAVLTAQNDNDEYWNCVVQNASDQLFHVTDISELSSFGTIVSDRLCATTSVPMTAIPTTSVPTTAIPTTSVPTTSIPTTSVPTTAIPTSSVPTTAIPTTYVPTTAIPTTSVMPTTESKQLKQQLDECKSQISFKNQLLDEKSKHIISCTSENIALRKEIQLLQKKLEYSLGSNDASDSDDSNDSDEVDAISAALIEHNVNDKNFNDGYDNNIIVITFSERTLMIVFLFCIGVSAYCFCCIIIPHNPHKRFAFEKEESSSLV